MSQNCRQMFTLDAISPYIYDIGQWSTWYISCHHLLWFIDLCHVFISNFTFVLTVTWIYGMHYFDLSIIVTFRCLCRCTHNYTNLRNIKSKSGSLSYLHFAYSCVRDYPKHMSSGKGGGGGILSRPQFVKALLMSVSYRVLVRYIAAQIWIIILNIEFYASLKYLRNMFCIWYTPVRVISEPNNNVTGKLLFCKRNVWWQLPLIIACSARSQCSALSVIRGWRLRVLNIVRCIKMIHYFSIHPR